MKKIHFNAKTALLDDSSLLSNTDQLPKAVRRILALVGFSISLGSAGAMLLHANTQPSTTAEITASPDTLNTVLSQNTDRKYDMARAAIASGDLERPAEPAVSPTPATPSVIIHEVKQDETLWQLTQMYRVDAASIAASNNISSATELQVGMKLVIPPVDGLIHKVRKGETLDSIAAFYKIAKSEIMKYSSVSSPDFLAIDQPLVIPGNVANLMQVKETNAKRQLFAERDRLRRRLAQIEGKTTLVSNTLAPSAPQIVKPAKKDAWEASLTTTYTVRLGDTVETIARRHGISQREIVALNKLENPNWIQVDQELKIPTANAKPATVTAANTTKPVAVKVAQPMVIASTSSPAPWDGLLLLAGSAPSQEQLSTIAVNTPSQPSLPVANELIALNTPVPANLPLERLTEQLPSPASSPAPSVLIAPEPTIAPVVPPKLPDSPALTEQEVKPARPNLAVTPQPAQEPQQTPQVVAAALPAPELPLSQIAEQVETRLVRPTTTAAVLAPESETRMATQEVQKLEQEVEQLSVKVREAEERKRQESVRLAAATLRPSSPTTVVPNLNPNSAPQLPNLTAKAYLPEVQDYGISTGFIWPANGVLTSGYGPRWGRIHQGIDIAAPIGTPVVAAASGKVVFSGWNDGGYGYLVEILHPDGTLTRYGHNSALYVKNGEQVNQGQLIAAMGSTGYSTGPHVHFEIRPNAGAAIDPMIYLARARR